MNYGSTAQRTLYAHAPFAVKNVLATAYGWRQRYVRYGNYFREYLKFLEQAQHFSSEQLLKYQYDQAWRLLSKAVSNVPYYREREIYADCLRDGKLSDLPILRKEEVREQLAILCNPEWKQLNSRWSHTSGTTGKSLRFPITLQCLQREYAFHTLHYGWSGVRVPGPDPVVFCQGHPVTHYDRKSPPYWVHDRANRFLMLSSYHLSSANLAAYIAELESFAPVMICGYPSSVHLLALAYKKHGRGRMRLRAVYTTSETLFEHPRAAIEDAFQCRVFDWYGNSEMCANIAQCEAGERHLKVEHSLVEILDDYDRPVSPGQTGRLVCTGFGNPAFPLIRYEVGDVVTIALDQRSKCGRSGLLIERIVGRAEDYVVTCDGRMVGRLDHLFKDSVNVLEAQVVQRKPGEVVLRVVKTEQYGAQDEQRIAAEAALRLGSDTTVQFDYVDCIARTSNGKFRFIDSTLSQNDLIGAVLR